MVKSKCKYCGEEIVRAGFKPGVFCNLKCKGEWQRTQKPVSRDWLYQKYVVEGLGTSKIGKLVKRDSKRVYEWLVDLEIPIRKRGWKNQLTGKLYQDKEWLRQKYQEEGISASDIAKQFEVTEANILFFMRRHNIPRRTISEARALKHWGSPGELNGMYGVCGENHPGWKGGHTSERQAFYNSEEWAIASRAVWIRDERTCQRCDKKKAWKDTFHIHHVVSFAIEELRADVDNLILFCAKCHRWVHGKENIEKLWIKEVQHGDEDYSRQCLGSPAHARGQ